MIGFVQFDKSERPNIWVMCSLCWTKYVLNFEKIVHNVEQKV